MTNSGGRNNVLARYDNAYDGNIKNKKPCYKCEKYFEHNEFVYLKRAKTGKMRIYHKKCWESTLQ